jgi:cobalt-zinc-cadmium efflux system outer membrane protein
LCFGILLASCLARSSFAQKALTWQEIRDRFEAANPTIRAGQIGIDESRAQEITAYLRPNPSLGLTADQINPFNGGPAHSTFGSLLAVAAAN